MSVEASRLPYGVHERPLNFAGDGLRAKRSAALLHLPCATLMPALPVSKINQLDKLWYWEGFIFDSTTIQTWYKLSSAKRPHPQGRHRPCEKETGESPLSMLTARKSTTGHPFTPTQREAVLPAARLRELRPKGRSLG